MKKILIVLLLSGFCHIASAQHYGGIMYAPYATIYSGSYNSKDSADKNFSFAYTVGYQGLIMPTRRFSFSYGLQYSYQYIENKSYYTDLNLGQYNTDQDIITGRREELHIIEIPATWRYNILKNKKLQPYISVSTTIVIPVSQKVYLINEEGEYINDSSNNYPPFILPDIGFGVNYTSNDWVFNVQPTIRPISIWKKIGIGFSVMKKF